MAIREASCFALAASMPEEDYAQRFSAPAIICGHRRRAPMRRKINHLFEFAGRAESGRDIIIIAHQTSNDYRWTLLILLSGAFYHG